MGYRSQVWVGIHDDYRQDFKLVEKDYGDIFYRKGRCKNSRVTIYKTRWDTKMVQRMRASIFLRRHYKSRH